MRIFKASLYICERFTFIGFVPRFVFLCILLFYFIFYFFAFFVCTVLQREKHERQVRAHIIQNVDSSGKMWQRYVCRVCSLYTYIIKQYYYTTVYSIGVRIIQCQEKCSCLRWNHHIDIWLNRFVLYIYGYGYGCVAKKKKRKRKHKFVYKCEHSYKYEEIYLWICVNIYFRRFFLS